jgi:hypothetical protein
MPPWEEGHMPRQKGLAGSRCSLLLLALLLLLAVVLPGSQPSAPASPPVPQSTQPRLELIRPGTVIEERAPVGWTHLILKSQPRLPDSERRKVGDTTAALATMVFMATTASVQAEDTDRGRQYRLARIGVGVGMNVGGRDMIVSPDSQRALGANLGLAERLVLSGIYDKQMEVRFVAVSRTGVVMDTPAFMPRGREHVPVVLRYVFLVDADTGRLDALVWRIDRDAGGRYQGVVGNIEWLPPNKMVDAVLQVDLNEFTLGVPSERAFAAVRVPQGQRQIAVPEPLQGIAGAPRLSPEAARQLDSGLRQLIRRAEVRGTSP